MEDGKEAEQKITKQTDAKQVVARYTYEASQPEDLEFQQGETILVLAKGKLTLNQRTLLTIHGGSTTLHNSFVLGTLRKSCHNSIY